MRVLCLADLHIHSFSSDVSLVGSVIDCVAAISPDVVVIAGDVFDNSSVNPYVELSGLGDMPIVFCLGNHEFYQHRGVAETLGFHRDCRVGNNVHCLDVDGRIDIAGVSFIGNVLWYDGSTSNYPWDGRTIYHGWLDARIPNFDWHSEHVKCRAAIAADFVDACPRSVLVTHTAPHLLLNKHYFRGSSPFNAYSGVRDLFGDLGISPDLAVCGHTHLPADELIGGIRCLNIGNDYHSNGGGLLYQVVEV